MPTALGRPLTQDQAAVIERMGRREDGEILRFSGGYWAPSGTPLHEGGVLHNIPTWWTGMDTLQALCRKGLVIWRDRHTWQLSTSGREVAAELRRLFATDGAGSLHRKESR